ncbi:hypothetical protein HBI75_112510 [Parastagonospora nodorum]|nr:hypothetical protein HBI75_112510 [Parastagonospora nodorum]KAH6114509.1 hypothetical protein HBI69_123620 [Parastagonospora nodorum]
MGEWHDARVKPSYSSMNASDARLSSTLALGDGDCCIATAFKTFDDSAADNSRPSSKAVSLDKEKLFGGTNAYDGLTAIKPWSSTKFLILL